MHAVVVEALGGPEVLEWRDAAQPVPKAGEVAIRVAHTGVNFADIMARRGGYHGGKEPPFIPGLDCAGTIVAITADAAGGET